MFVWGPMKGVGNSMLNIERNTIVLGNPGTPTDNKSYCSMQNVGCKISL